MLFETRKVPLETLGEYLAEIRQELGLSVAEISQKIGISEKYLLSLEQGKYHHLPPDVYVCGFLKKLSEIYAINEEVLLTQYKKERNIIDHVANRVVIPEKGFKLWLSRIVITPKVISLVSGVGLALVAMIYLTYQVSAINRVPTLEIFQPASGSKVAGSSVTVSGQTDPGTSLSINNQSVPVDAQGKFQLALGINPGQTELDITAENKFGKQATDKVVVVADAPVATQTSAPTNSAPSAPNLSLQLNFAKSTTIKVNSDGVASAPEVVPANSSKVVEAQSKIVVTTSDAGATTAELNGKVLGVLGRANETLTVPFTINSNP